MNDTDLMQFFKQGMTVNTEFAVRTLFDKAYQLGRASVLREREAPPPPVRDLPGPVSLSAVKTPESEWPDPTE